MKNNSLAEKFLIKALGDEGVAELRKFDLYKIKTNTVVDAEEIRTALQIVPRTILSLLQNELSDLQDGNGKEIKLPVDNAFLQITKMTSDVYSGEIRQGSKIVANFSNRSLPGVGLVIMTTFELYDISELSKEKPTDNSEMEAKVQKIIDDRLNFHSMVSKVVDQKISEREALDNLIRMRLTQAIKEAQEVPKADLSKPKKLKSFLDSRKKEYRIEMAKSESVSCPDCTKQIFAEGIYSGCICFGEDRNNTVFVKKSEDGYSMRFPKGWDKENIQLLLETLRNRSKL